MYTEKYENWFEQNLSFTFSFKIWPIVVQTTNKILLPEWCSKSSAFQAEDWCEFTHGRNFFLFSYDQLLFWVPTKNFSSRVCHLYVEKIFYLSVWFIPCYTLR